MFTCLVLLFYEFWIICAHNPFINFIWNSHLICDLLIVLLPKTLWLCIYTIAEEGILIFVDEKLKHFGRYLEIFVESY